MKRDSDVSSVAATVRCMALLSARCDGGISGPGTNQSALMMFGDNALSTLACQETDSFSFACGSAGDIVVAHVTECSDFGGVCNGACF